MNPNKMNILQGLKALVNMKVDLRAYGREVENGEVKIPTCLVEIHEAVLAACEAQVEDGDGDGETREEVLWYYIDRATAM